MKIKSGFIAAPVVLGLFFALILGAGVYFFSTRLMLPTEGQSIKPSDISWNFTEAGADENGISRTNVFVTVKGEEHKAGSYAGTCTQIGTDDSNERNLFENEISAVQCWFAGSGDEVGVFKEGNKLLLKHGELGEPTETEPPFRGNFEVLFEL